MKRASEIPAQCWVPVLATLMILAGYSIALPRKDTAASGVLRVCADPNNLPFSNVAGEGFENRIAQMLASEMELSLAYTWWPQRRGFIRHTLNAGDCDLVIGVPEGFELAQTTAAYYISSYVLVTRRNDRLGLGSLHDEGLRELRIGVHAIGDDYANIPPVQVLAMRGITRNVRGYRIYGDYSQPDPPRDLIDALADGGIDVAIAWGPIAAYFAHRVSVPMDVIPLPPSDSSAQLPMRFGIAMAVRHGDDALQDAVESALRARREQIRHLLAEYHVPRIDIGPVAHATDVR